ncbi:MAG: dTMP kinase [Clostridia bacterium]|nr:dTMP kinase [Oscillospiraceae bacterium]MBQ7960025.1 dTMP kinase [Clostridia bacterium]
MKNRGKFIVFEGIDGSGKSTQMKLLAERLEKKGIKTRLTLEPTYGLVGETLHNILSGKIKADPKVTAALFVADRLDHITNENDGVLKSLEAGETVICDRYYFSSYAYQSTEVPSEWVVEANKLCADSLRPDVTIFVDISPQVAMERILTNRDTVEIYETEEKLTKVREAYFAAFEKMKDTENVKIINGERNIEKIAEDIADFVIENIIQI